jgi:GNAT superfamily N-acetyltransferase
MIDAMRVTVRPATDDDEGFLRDLFVAVRGPMFAGLPDEVTGPLLRRQHDAQRHGHASTHPAAEDAVVELDGRPVGRWLVERGTDALTIVDVAVLPEHQGHGIGTHLLEALIAESDRDALPIRLSVAVESPARRLYERLGFLASVTGSAYVLMTREVTARHRDEPPDPIGKDGQ